MLKVPRIAGSAQLRLFVQEVGFHRSCCVLKVHENTLRRWLNGVTEPPAAALQALYWLTSWGFSDAAAEVHWSHQILLMRVRQLEAAFAWRAPSDQKAVNEADFRAPGLVLTLVQG